MRINVHLWISYKTYESDACFFCGDNAGSDWGCLGHHNGDPHPCCFEYHVCRLPTLTHKNGIREINVRLYAYPDHFVNCIMATYIFGKCDKFFVLK